MLRSFSIPSQQIRPLETTIGEREGLDSDSAWKEAADAAHLTGEHTHNHAHNHSSSHSDGSETDHDSDRSPADHHADHTVPQQHHTSERSSFPTPAIMPKKKASSLSTETFASLDDNELPVSREYSAGGLIFNDDDEVAIIARHSRSGHLEWCLPKGHIEKGETPEQTAVREVHEETGILGKVTGSIATIDYWFTGSEERVHKLVHHYVLHQTAGHLTVSGDPDHEAEDAAWVPFDKLTSILSYPNERRIVWLYMRKYDKKR